MLHKMSLLAVGVGLFAGAAQAQTPATAAATPAGRIYIVQPAPHGTQLNPVAEATPHARGEPMRRLLEASDELRESIKALAQQPPGPARDTALAQAHEALLTTQRAMLQLPPELRERGQAAGAGYDASVQALMDAADELRDAIHAMATAPAGESRQEAIRSANRALIDTETAMVNAYDATAVPAATQRMGAAGTPR